MNQLTRLRVMDAIHPGRLYTMVDILNRVDAPEAETRRAVRRLVKNRAINVVGRKPYVYTKAEMPSTKTPVFKSRRSSTERMAV